MSLCDDASWRATPNAIAARTAQNGIHSANIHRRARASPRPTRIPRHRAVPAAPIRRRDAPVCFGVRAHDSMALIGRTRASPSGAGARPSCARSSEIRAVASARRPATSTSSIFDSTPAAALGSATPEPGEALLDLLLHLRDRRDLFADRSPSAASSPCSSAPASSPDRAVERSFSRSASFFCSTDEFCSTACLACSDAALDCDS